MKTRNTQEDTGKVRDSKRKSILDSLKATLKLGMLVILISSVILGGRALIDNQEYLQNRISAKNLAMTYEEVEENDNATQSEHVKFDAYFLQANGGATKKTRGAVIELNDRQEVYLELNVLTNGHLENGKITLSASNFNVARNIVTDNEIVAVQNANKNISLNTIQNGTYKTIPVLIEQTVVASGSGNKDKLSKINSATFTGTHVAEDGTRTPVEKTVEFQVDWYGRKDIEEFRLYRDTYIANQASNKVIIGLRAEAWSGTMNDSSVQAPDKAAIFTSTIPLLNNYAPTEVQVIDSSNPAKKLDYTYNPNTRKLEVREEIKYNEKGIGEIAKYGQHYKLNINIVYPYVAYQTLGANARNLNVTMKGQLEGYNNPNDEFINPVKSKEASKTVSINLRSPEGDVILFETEVGLLTKSKLRLKYDRNINTDNGYRVTWKARVNYIGNIGKLIYEEDDEDNEIGPERRYITDQMQADDGTYYDLEGLVDYVGIKIPETSMRMLGEEGYVKVINAKTGEVIKNITAIDADKYLNYDEPIEHLKIETSELRTTGNFEIYHYKKIDNQAFVDKYTKSQFNSMSLVYSSLNGSAEFDEREEFINRDVDVVEYEDGSNLVYVTSSMQLETQTLNQKKTVVELKSNFNYKEDKNTTEWVNPIIILEYPEEIESIRIKNISSKDNELTLLDVIQKVINGKKVITVKMEGVTQEGSEIVIDQEIRVNGKTTKETGELRVFAYNELCDIWRYIYQNTQEAPDIYDINKDGNKQEKRNISITELIYARPTGLNTNTETLNFDDKGSIIMGPGVVEIEKQNSKKEATIRINVYNNYSAPVTNAKIVGKIPFEGNTYQINGGDIGSKFTTMMKNTGIILPDSIKNSVDLYYSTHEIVNENINDSSNGWTKTPSDWSKVRTYLIDLSRISMAPRDSYTIDYNILFPEKLTYGTASYATHAIYFEENTASGKVERSTETNKVGFSITTTKDYTLQLTKLQKDTTKTIRGVKYKITGPGIREEGINYTTDEQGKIIINNLYPEEIYTLEETYATENYIKAEEPIQLETYLEDGNLKARIIKGTIKGEPLVENAGASSASIKIEVENEAKYDIQITKYETGTTKTLPNIKFLVKGKGISEEGRTFTTNNNGIVAIKGLEPGEIYTIKETYAKGYYVDETEFTVKVEKIDGNLQLVYNGRTGKQDPVLVQEENAIPRVELSFENVNIPKYSLELTKIAEKTAKLLEGAKFEVVGKGRETVNERQYVTAKNGTLTIEELYENEEYTLREIVAPVGYKLNEQLVKFKATQQDGNWNFEVLEGSFKEEIKIEGTTVKVKWEDELLFKLEKVDEETGKPLAGAKYTIEKLDENRNVTGYATDVSGNEIGEIENINGEEKRVVTTNAEGMYTTELAPGIYQVTEVQAPFGYDLPKDPVQYFGIDEMAEEKREAIPTWATSVGGDKTEKINSVVPTEDGGFIAVGEFDSIDMKVGEYTLSNKGGLDGMIIKYKPLASGDGCEVEWATSIGDSARDCIESIAVTKDGGFVVGGWFRSDTIQVGGYTLTNQGIGDGILIKYKPAVSGKGYEVEWAASVGGKSLDSLQSIATTEDGGFIAGGQSESSNFQVGDYTLTKTGLYDGMLIKYIPKTNGQGYEVEWATLIGGSKSDNIVSISETADGGFLAGGWFESSNVQVGDYILTNQRSKDGMFIKYKPAVSGQGYEVEWATSVGGNGTERIRSMTITEDGGFLVGGWFDSSSVQVGDYTLSNQGNCNGMIIKYKSKEEGYEVEWATSIGELWKEIISSIVTTSDGGFIAVGTFESASIQIGEYTLINQNAVPTAISSSTDIMIIKYIPKADREEYEVEWATSVGGKNSEYIESMAQTIDGGYIVGGDFQSSSIQVGDYTLTKQGGKNGMLIKYKEQVKHSPIPQTQEITFQDSKKDYHIYTKVEGTGGNISGYTSGEEALYETVKYQANSTKDVIITPQTGYSVKSITINGEEIKFTRNPDGSVKLDKFENMLEDKHIVVSFTANPAEVIVHHYIDGTTTSLPMPDGSTAQDEIIYGEVDQGYTTNPKTDLGKYELVTSKMPANANGIMTAETINVTYYYQLKDAKVIVHHYIEGTTDPVPMPDGTTVQDEEINGKIDEKYTTQPKDLEKYEVVETKLPENAQGIMTEEPIEVIYYYKIRQVKITTEVEGVGGTISGENENPYEIVNYGENSIKDLVITPDGNYKVKRVTINGEEIRYTADRIGTVVLDTFEQMTEDKHIVVSFEKISTGTVTVKYIDIDTGEEISNQVMIGGYTGEEYSTVRFIKEIERYILVEEVVENETGTYIEGNINVVYRYQRIPAKVIVKYLEKGTEKQLAQEEILEGVEGDPYDVTDLEKDIKGYNKVEEKPANKEGEMTVEDITVIYYYERKPVNIIESNITKTGTDKLIIPIVDPKVSYTITYRAQIADYMGNAKVTITDYLPYEIDGESAELDGGTYDQEKKTITWEETIEDIDTYENGNKEIVITKQIEVVYKNMDFSKEGFVNKAKGKITFDATNQEKETPEVEKETKFEKPEIELETTVEKTGDEKITSTETPIYYEVNYTATINHFIGKAAVRFVDKLPYGIDEEKSDLSNFGTKTTMEELGPGKYVYNAEEKTITWEEIVEDINTFQALEAKVLNKTKSFSVQYIYDNNGETLSGTLENTVKATTDLVENKKPEGENPGEQPEEKVVKTEEKQDNHEVAVELPAQVIVHHYIYDKERSEYTSIKVPSTIGGVVQDEEITGLVGEKYTTAKSNQVAENYEVVSETPDKYEGAMTKTPIEVTYYYQLKDETVTSEITKTARADKTIEKEGVNIEVLTTEGGAIRYSVRYKVKIENYIGKAKVTIVDVLPSKINLENVDLKGGLYNRLMNTITWEEEITGIDTFKEGKAFERIITKEIDLVYEDQNKVEPIINKVTGTVKTYYPDNYPIDPIDPANTEREKTVETKEDTETVEQEYKVNKTVEKVWEDNENAKKKRPASVRIQLTANEQTTWEGQTLENAILSEENNWKHTFENLPKYDGEGNGIGYSVQEGEVNEKDLEYYETPQITVVEEQNKIIVTNSYKLVNTELESGVEKTGTEKITSANQEVNYHIHYQANIKDYIGEAIVTITDTLPYHIDEDKSDLAGGTYNEDTKTIIWTQNLGHINTEEIEKNIYPVSIEKDIIVHYKDIVTREDKMTNNVKGKIEFTENDTKNEVTDSHETLIGIKGRVITKYVEKATGKEIAERKDEEGKVGLEYSAYPKKIYGYTFLEDSGNTVGKVIEGIIEIIFYYEKTDGGDVIVKYVDEEGKEIVPQETIEGKIGDPYKTEPKELEEYELEKVTGDPEEGTFDENSKEVIYHYRKRPTKVIVRYLEKGTEKPLAIEEIIEGRIGDSYATTRKIIEGYQKAEPEPTNANGSMKKESITVTYYYEKIPSGKITVKYIEYETKQEITYQDEKNEKKSYTYEISGYVGEKYETKEKEIPYYEYLRNLEPGNKTGVYKEDDDTVIYYYRKLPFNIAVDKKIKTATVDGEEYNIGKNEKLTKIEVAASEIGKTKVEIRYGIKVSNTGEIEGTAKVVDKIPEGFKVSSSNPNYWKSQGDGSLETTVELKAKETKELEVVLNWKNGNSNFGSMRNIAEIRETTNPANYLETTVEDNRSEATVVMSIKTGKQKQVLVTALGTIVSSGMLVLLYQYQRYQKEREREIRHVVLDGKNVVIKKQKQK